MRSQNERAFPVAAPLARAMRQRGAWFGLAVGDALGAPYEFKHPQTIAVEAPARLVMQDSPLWAAGEWTDDTDLTLAASAAYVGDYFSLSGAANAMVAWLESGPKDVGHLTRRALGAIARGAATPAQSGEWAMHGNPQAAGNGSLMRASPTGLRRAAADPRLDQESAALSRVTHADPRCVQACIAYNVVLANLIDGCSAPAALEAALKRADNMDVQAVLRRCLDGGAASYENQTGSGFVLLALEWAVMALRDSPSFATGIESIIRCGGDADTNAAIAGALLGARFGYHAIPKDWLVALRRPDLLDKALRQLLGPM